MARPLRLEFAGALYHLTSRGDRREPIFEDDDDRRALLEVLAQALERFEATCFAYCLMGNHYHFVVQTRRPNLSRLMRHVNGVYTQRFNRRHGKVGHLFQGRFKAVLVDEDSYFLEVCRYVDLNPVRAGLVRRAQDWVWSSFRSHARIAPSPAWLASDELHRHIAPRAPRRDGPARYAEFVSQGKGVRLWEQSLAGQIYLGDAAFVERMRKRNLKPDEREIPRAQRRAAPMPIAIYLSRSASRDEGIARAHVEGGHTQTSIASAIGLSVSRISRLVTAYEEQHAKDET